MKVTDESGKSVAAGDQVSLAELGLPVDGTRGVLLVFWKET